MLRDKTWFLTLTTCWKMVPARLSICLSTQQASNQVIKEILSTSHTFEKARWRHLLLDMLLCRPSRRYYSLRIPHIFISSVVSHFRLSRKVFSDSWKKTPISYFCFNFTVDDIVERLIGTSVSVLTHLTDIVRPSSLFSLTTQVHQ